MCSQAILTDSRVTAWRKEIIFETRLDHPPAKEALETNHTSNTSDAQSHWLGDPSLGDKIDSREDERQANKSAPEAVDPFHVVNFLEFRQVHVRVQQVEFG